MVGLHGAAKNIHPGPAMDKNLNDLSPAELTKVPTACDSLQEAIGALRLAIDNWSRENGRRPLSDHLNEAFEILRTDI